MSVSADSQARWLGFAPVGTPNSTTSQLNSANNRIAMSFIAPSTSRTITSAWQYCSALSGTVTAANTDVELQADSAGSPSNTPLQTVDCNVTPANNTLLNWTLSTALTPGARYWIVTRNNQGTPASNNITIRCGNAASSHASAMTDGSQHWVRRTSTDATTWSAALNQCAGLMVGYDDGSFDGFPIHQIGTTVVGEGVYAARELGNIFTTPAVSLRVRGVRLHLQVKTGSPTGSLRARIYEGTTLLATSNSLHTTTPAAGLYEFWFTSTLSLAASTSHRVTVGETTQSDASTNRYNLRELFIFDTADAKSLMPFAGTMQKVYYNGATWDAAVSTSIIPMELNLDPTQPIEVSGGGMLRHPGMAGGLSA